MIVGIFVAAFLAFAVSAVAGGGASLALVPLLAMVLPVASVPAALSLGTGVSSVARIATFRRSIRWDITRIFVPAALPSAAFGGLVLRYVNPAYVQLGMAVFLVANLGRLLRPGPPPSPSTAPAIRPLAIAAVGAAAGFLSGLTGAVGVVFNGFYLRQGLTKDEIVATRAANEVLIHLVKLAMYAALGLLTVDALGIGITVAVAAALSAVALERLLPRIPALLFARIGYGAMVVSGVALLVSSAESVVTSDRIAIETRLLLDGADTTMHWRDSALALELTYDEGLEIELPLDARELTDAQRAVVVSEDPGSDTILYESVYGVGERHVEAYYLREGHVVRQIEFDLEGRLDPT